MDEEGGTEEEEGDGVGGGGEGGSDRREVGEVVGGFELVAFAGDDLHGDVDATRRDGEFREERRRIDGDFGLAGVTEAGVGDGEAGHDAAGNLRGGCRAGTAAAGDGDFRRCGVAFAAVEDV